MATTQIKLRQLMLIVASFIAGFYTGYMNASSFCDPLINESIEHPLYIAMKPSPINQITLDNKQKQINIITTDSSNIVKSNLFDEIYEWQYFKNRNTEISPYFVPHHQIIFCGIPKNAVSMWKMVLLRLHKKKWWLTKQSKIHAAQNGLAEYRLWDRNFTQITEWMNDPKWYKAVFIRDPLERALSAVLDKGYILKFNWDTFIEYLSQTLINSGQHMIDQHLRPQHKFCDLYKYHKQYHIFSHHNTTHRKLFFDDNGLWEKYGSNGWSKEDHNTMNTTETKHNITAFGNIFRRHSSKSIHRILKLFTMQKVAFLLKYYQYDYILFNLSIPEWICQIIANEYELIGEYIIHQNKMGNAIEIKRANKVNKLRKAAIFYGDFIDLYTALKIFPVSLQPTCMTVITHCVEYGKCHILNNSSTDDTETNRTHQQMIDPIMQNAIQRLKLRRNP